MKPTDDRDDRLKKLFSALPRLQAPADFEERIARRLGRGRAGGAFHPARLRAYTIPGLAFLLVGALSYVVYLTQFRIVEGDRSPAADTMAAPNIQSEPKRSLPDDARRTMPALPEAPRQTGTGSRAGDEAGDEKMSAPVEIRPEPSAAPLPPRGKGAAGSAQKLNVGKTAPGRSLMMEQAVIDSMAKGDSLAIRDTSSVDSTHTLPDSLRDSTRIPKPD